MQSDTAAIHSMLIEFAQKIYEETGVSIDLITFRWERIETMATPPGMKIKSVSIDSTKEQ